MHATNKNSTNGDTAIYCQPGYNGVSETCQHFKMQFRRYYNNASKSVKFI